MTSPYVLSTLLLYSVSLALYIWNLREPSRMAGIGATVCLIGALGLHYLALLERSRLIHAVPYDDLFGSLSLFAWLLAATYLVLEAIHAARPWARLCCRSCSWCFYWRTRARRGRLRPPGARPAVCVSRYAEHPGIFRFRDFLCVERDILLQNRRLRDHKLGMVGGASRRSMSWSE